MTAVPARQARALARSLAIGRVGLGVVALIAPGPLARLWVGRSADPRALDLFGRIVGGREVALGLGAVLALEHGAPVRGWMEGASLADTVDCLVTAVHFRRLPRFTRWVVLLGAASAAIAEAAAARTVDVSSPS